MVRFTPAEGRAMARALGLAKAAFYARHAREVDGAWSLRERKTEHGYDCVFLDRHSSPGKAICSVYAVRPGQCRAWPFWPENMDPEGWRREVASFCPGVGRGRRYARDEIEAILDGGGEAGG